MFEVIKLSGTFQKIAQIEILLTVFSLGLLLGLILWLISID